MTDIRSARWRSKYGISKLQADDRIDEAFSLIDQMQTLFPVGISLDAGIIRDRFATTKVVAKTGASRPFDPDYICFLGYAYYVLSYVETKHPEAEKVDFIVELNGQVTKYIQEFHSNLAVALEALGKPSLSRLVGEMIPAGKERVPLQVADVLCWHTARYEHPETMDADDLRRYGMIAHRKGAHWRMKHDDILKLEAGLSP
jgi:hypothetical protein